ncbi:MAG: hypothetical protein NTZ24_13170 [Deltaproteobacteria bacterium]|nr:hypothetical protein [Deltaproteobacteria bacterium]
MLFPALEWLAAMCSHIPNRGEQMVRYYGYYSNVSCGKRQKEGHDDAIPCIFEPQGDEPYCGKQIIDIQTELSYISHVRKQCLIKQT